MDVLRCRATHVCVNSGIMHDPRFSLSRDFSPRKSPHRANEWRPIFYDQFGDSRRLIMHDRSIDRWVLPSVAEERWRSMKICLYIFFIWLLLCGVRYSDFLSLIIRMERYQMLDPLASTNRTQISYPKSSHQVSGTRALFLLTSLETCV